MCTSMAYTNSDFYFCRNMDLDYHFGEKIVITPRNAKLNFKHEKTIEHHYAIIGIATVIDSFPLYAEAVNEKGLCVSAQNFPGNAHYEKSPLENALNLAPYEVIPYILSSFATVSEVEKGLAHLKIIDTPFKSGIPTTPLHFLIADAHTSIVLETTRNGTKIHKNPLGIMTNNPPFEEQLAIFENYSHLTPVTPSENAHSLGLDLQGLPGDFSSSSRFIRLSILKKHLVPPTTNEETLSALFTLMSSVSIPKGLVKSKSATDHYTTYTCVINATKGIYYTKLPSSTEIKRTVMTEPDFNQTTIKEIEI